MNWNLSTRAKIALDQLPLDERKRAERFIASLGAALRLSDLGDKIYKLYSDRGEQLFVGRIGVRYRAVLRCNGQFIDILEIIDHDRLERTYRIGGIR